MKLHKSSNDDIPDRWKNADEVNEAHKHPHINERVKREREAEAKGCRSMQSDLFHGLLGHNIGFERHLVSLQPDHGLNDVEGPVLRSQQC
jgi:hypothetical protein